MLTDDQCDEFRRLPCSFNDMVRAIYESGYDAGKKVILNGGIRVHIWRDSVDQSIIMAHSEILPHKATLILDEVSTD